MPYSSLDENKTIYKSCWDFYNLRFAHFVYFFFLFLSSPLGFILKMMLKLAYKWLGCLP